MRTRRQLDPRPPASYNRGMNCPACKAPLLALEYNEIEVDYCDDCHGIWLDAGELDLLFGDRAVTNDFLRAGDRAGGTASKMRPCPICGIKMDLHTTGGAAPVTYDECPRHHGMWFDRGELQQILLHGSAAPGGERVVTWLRDLFGTGETADTVE